MKYLLDLFLKNKLSTVVMTIVTGLTFVTSAAGAIKVAGNMSEFKTKIPEVKTVETALKEESELIKTIDNNSTKKPSPTPTPKTTTLALNPNLSNSSSLSSSNTTNISACMITLFGKQYDITTLQNNHSGGNVFTCGADQTALYQSQHGNNLGRMKSYLVGISSTSGSTVSSNSSSSKKPHFEVDDDFESELDENENEENEKNDNDIED